MSYYWISWVQPGDDVRPLHYPPGQGVLGWWSTGYIQGGQTLCAMVRAANEQEAKGVVAGDWPEANEWRFCEHRETPEVAGRFPLKDWMLVRMKAQSAAEDGHQHTHEARRWCHGDSAWSEWQPCTAVQAASYAKDETFQVRTVLRAARGEG